MLLVDGGGRRTACFLGSLAVEETAQPVAGICVRWGDERWQRAWRPLLLVVEKASYVLADVLLHSLLEMKI